MRTSHRWVRAVVLAQVILVGCSLLAPRHASGDSQATPEAQAIFSHLSIAERTMKTFHAEGRNPVSVAEISHEETVVLCGSQIWLLRKVGQSYESIALRPPVGVRRWKPTSVSYDNKTETLYVAMGEKVLGLRCDIEAESLSLQRAITCDGMRDATNVWVAPDGSVLVSDYGANAVFQFSEVGTCSWRAEVPEACGICEMDGRVFVTSLRDRTVVELDRQGRIVSSQGSMGILPGQYLWPADIEAIGDGYLAVVDPYAGRITILDETLKVMRTLGGNGPGVDLFNYPSDLRSCSGGFLVADAKKSRLVRFSSQWTVVEQIIMGDHEISGTGLPVFRCGERSSHVGQSPPAVDVLRLLCIVAGGTRECWGGLNSIDVLGSDCVLQSIEVSNLGAPSVVALGSMNMIWAKRESVPGWGCVIVVGSPQQPSALAIDEVTGAWSNISIGQGCWMLGDTVVDENGTPVDLRQRLYIPVRRFQEVQRLIREGTDRTEAFCSVLEGMTEEGGFGREYWKPLLSASREGQEFYESCLKDSDVGIQATKYYAAIALAPRVDLLEALAVHFIAGANAKALDFEAYATCLFEEGRGINVAANNSTGEHCEALPDQEDYGIRLVLKHGAIPNLIALEWVDSQNRITAFDVRASGPNGRQAIKYTVRRDGSITYIDCDTYGKRVNSIDLRPLAFSGRQRLILNSIRLYGKMPKLGFDDICRLSESISKKLVYSGEPLTWRRDSATRTTVRDIILGNGHGHCGHFAYLFLCEAAELGLDARTWGISKADGVAHSVVEVYDETTGSFVVADPTVGIAYRGSLWQLLTQPDKAYVELPANDLKRWHRYVGSTFFGGSVVDLRQYVLEDAAANLRSTIMLSD